MVVAFFGHKDAGADIEPKIKEVVKDLIEYRDADTFLSTRKLHLIRPHRHALLE